MKLEGGRLLAFDAHLVDRVHEHNRVGVDKLTHDNQGLVEIARQG